MKGRVAMMASLLMTTMLSGCIASGAELESARSETKALGERIEAMRLAYAELSQERNETQREADAVAAQASRAESRLTARDAEIRELKGEVARLKGELRTAQSRTAEAESRARAAESQNEATYSNLVSTVDEWNTFSGKALLIDTGDVYGDGKGELEDFGFITSRTGAGYDFTYTGDFLTPVISARLDSPAVFVNEYTVMASDSIYCTGSMRPTIDCDDVIIGYEPSETELKVGDIISYTIPESPDWVCHFEGSNILHRIYKVESGNDGVVRYWMQGDNNGSPDDCGVPWSMVNYKVLGVIYNSRL